MQDATEFGKVLRGLMVNHNLRQEQMAKELGVSPSILSNYLTGKNIPEMDFLAKCVKRFSLSGMELSKLFYTAFLSNAISSHHKIVLDTRFIDPTRLEMLSKFLTILLLYPKVNLSDKLDAYVRNNIDNCFSDLKEKTDFNPPNE